MGLLGAPGSKQDLCQTAPWIRCAGVSGVDRSLHRGEGIVGVAEALVGLGELAEELRGIEDARGVPYAAGLPELDVARVQRWCAVRVPDHARHQVRVEC